MTKKRKELLEVRHPSRPQFVDGHPVASEDDLKQLRKDFQHVSTISLRRSKPTDQSTTGQPTQSTPKESLWSKRPWIPSGDPRLQGGFVIGERRSRPLSKNGT